MAPSKLSSTNTNNNSDFFSVAAEDDPFIVRSQRSATAYQFHKCDIQPPTLFTHPHTHIPLLLPPPLCHQPEWLYRRPRLPPVDKMPETSPEQTFWSNIIRPRSKADRSIPVLGNTNARDRSMSRRRVPSLTSIPSLTSESVSESDASTSSSVTKPIPPPEFNLKTKSIMTRTSSVSTKNSQSKSVKFIDTPTVILDHEYEFDMDYPYHSPTTSTMPLSPKGKSLWRFGWFAGSDRNEQGNARPVISGPFVLGSARSGDQESAVSGRSIRSATSGKSARSKLKKSASFPLPLRSPPSMESFRSTRSSGASGKFKAFCSWG